jgi:hypothetical protein
VDLIDQTVSRARARGIELHFIRFAVSFWPTGPGPVFRDYQGLCRFGTALIFGEITRIH